MLSCRKNRKKRAPQKNKFLLVKIVVFVLLLSLLSVPFFLRRRIWNGKEIMGMAINRYENGVSVLIFDPVERSMVNLNVPANTQVSAAGEYGSWKLGSIWQLGLNEKINGSLLARTVTKNFSFPVTTWADSQAYGYFEGGFISLLRATFGVYKSNLSLGDRLRIALSTLKVPKTGRDSFDIKDSGFLKKTRFVDGEEGYTVYGQIPEKLAAYFFSNNLSGRSFVAKITDATETANIGDRVGKVVEVMGVKVGVITKEVGKDIPCLVTGKNRQLVERMSAVFGCKGTDPNNDIGNFDVELILGKKFVKMF